MSEFIWRDDYKLGNETIDQQHKHLFELANKIVETDNPATLTHCVMQLYRHIREHFQTEEDLMKQFGYPAYEEHIRAHNEMLDKLVAISDSIHAGTWEPNDISVFMHEWVLVHILRMDMMLGDFLHRHTQQPQPDQPSLAKP